MSFNMYVPARTLFGAGELKNPHTQKMPGKKAMIVISEEFETMAKNAKDTMGGLFLCDRSELSVDDCVDIYTKSYK